MNQNEEKYEDRVLDHDFDGIQEYDNRLPNWWLWTLWGAIVFSIGYWFLFHTYGVLKNPVAKYEAAMATAEPAVAVDARGLTEEDLIAMSQDPAMLATGQEVYAQYCQVCHLPNGAGLVGPNLTDNYWLHGGTALDIHDTLVNGVVEKGMAAWGRQLGPDRIDALTVYLLTMRGTNVDGGKAPQGEFWVPEEASAPVEGADEDESAADTAA